MLATSRGHELSFYNWISAQTKRVFVRQCVTKSLYGLKKKRKKKKVPKGEKKARMLGVVEPEELLWVYKQRNHNGGAPFPPFSLKAAATRRAKDRRAHAAAASQHEHAKSVQPEEETAQKPGQPLVFSPSLCIYFQVSAILSKPAERPGRRRRRRYTVSRKTRAKEGKKENSHRKTKCIRRLPWRWPSCIS